MLEAARSLSEFRDRDEIEVVLQKCQPFMGSQSWWFRIQEMEDEEKYFDKYFLAQYPRIVSSDFTPTFEGNGQYDICSLFILL